MRRPLHAALAGALVTVLAVSLATVPTPALADPDEGRPPTPPGIEVADDVPVADPLAEEATEALATAEVLLAGVEPAPQDGTETLTEDGGRGTGDTDGADGAPRPADATSCPRGDAGAARPRAAADSLPADEQRRATQLLARPSSSGRRRVCGVHR